MVDLRGEEERVEEGRQKINQKLLYTKDPKNPLIYLCPFLIQTDIIIETE